MEVLLEETTDLRLGDTNSTLRYGLLAQTEAGRKRYGVSVSNERTGERTLVRDAVLSRPDAEALLARLVAGTVTPVTFRDVVEDFVAEI